MALEQVVQKEVLELSKSSGIEVSRRRQSFYATNTGSYTSTNSSQIRIELNIDTELIDFATGYLMFDLYATGSTGGITTLPDWAASSWIRDFRVYDRAGREIGEQVRQYNGYYRKQMELLSNDGANASYLARLEGAESATNSNNGGETTTSEEFAHKIITHIFDINSYFPAFLMGGLVFEFDMERTENVVVVSGGTPVSYTLSNVRYVCDLITLKPEVNAQLIETAARGELMIHYTSPMNTSQAITTNTNQRFDLGIASGRVKSAQAFMVLDSQRANDSLEYFGGFSKNNLSTYRWRLGTKYLTEKDVQISDLRQSEYLIEFLKSENLDSMDIVHFYGDRNLILDDWFCIGQKVEVSRDPSVSSGVRDFQANKVELELQFSSSPASATLYTNIELEKVLNILGGREFRNLD